MKRITLLCVIFLACLAPLRSQWQQVGYLITNGTDTAGLDHGFDAYGSDVYLSTMQGLFRSGDNGDNWQNITDGKANVDGEEFYCVHVATNGDLIAGTSTSLFKSTNNGSSWSKITTVPDSATWFDVNEIGGNLLASFSRSGSAGVYYSADGGANWTMATGITSIPRYFLVDGTDAWVGGGANGVYKSTDNGQSWAVSGIGFPSFPGIWSVIKSGSAYYANSVTGVGLFVSRDNGLTWANADTTVFHDFCQIFSMTESNGRILTSMDGACNNSDPVKSSTDNGMTWPVFMDSLPVSYYASVGRNAQGTSFFAKRGGSWGQKVYRYDLVATSLDQAQVSQVSVFPIPARDYIQVNLEGAETANTQIVIYDPLGKVLLQTQLTDGQTRIETATWPRGIYSYRIAQQSGKIILVD